VRDWRTFRFIFAAFLAVWFGAIVPGHRRGIVQLPEAHCEACANCPHDSKSPAPAGHCAICYFALTLSNPPIVIPRLDRLNLIERVAPTCAMESASIDLAVAYFGRAPPAVIA